MVGEGSGIVGEGGGIVGEGGGFGGEDNVDNDNAEMRSRMRDSLHIYP